MATTSKASAGATTREISPSRALRRRTLVLIILSVALALACILPRYGVEEDEAMFRAYDAALRIDGGGSDSSLRLPAVSFNLRFDVSEADPSNNWSARLPRIGAYFARTNPWLAGLQETFVGQLQHLLSTLPPRYKAVWHERPAGEPVSYYRDAQVAILYDSERLQLVESEWVWLSATPEVEDSVSWGAGMPRNLNIALFRVRAGQTLEGTLLLHANTHLDVWSEQARREQSKLVAARIESWQSRYPDAIAILTGDFNTAPGQAAYMTLASSMRDAWVECKQHSDTCVSNSLSHSFHGWTGTLLNTSIGRLLNGALVSLYAMDFNFPTNIPRSFDDVLKAARQLASRAPNYPLWEGVPLWPWNRFHIDWILYRQSKQQQTQATPVFVALLDARSTNFSSDHFPLAAVFQLKRNAAAAASSP